MMRGQDHPIGVPLWPGRHSTDHVESIGESWATATEDYLVGALAYLTETGHPEGQSAASAELNRRLLAAIRIFNKQSREQTDALITQTSALVDLARETGKQNATMIAAIRDFDAQSSRQAKTMIRLTWSIVWLTVVLGTLAALQLWAMLIGA